MRTKPNTPTRLGTQPPRAVDVAVLEQLFDQVPDEAFFVKDLEGRYTAVNWSLIERHGLERKEQAIGRRPRDICPGAFGRVPSQQDAEVLRSKQPLLNHFEMQWQTPHEPCWCLTTKLPLLDAEGNVIGLIGISRDLRAPVKPQEVPPAVATALHRLERSLGEPTTPSELAAWCKLTPARLARLMKRFFGLTPGQYIAKVRIAAASSLLQQTDQSIAEIAAACGFESHSAFTRAFGKIVGVSPARFRKTTSRSRDSS